MAGYGEVAYAAYCAQTDGRSAVTGEPLPAWDEQRQEIRDAWDAAAAAVVDAHVLGTDNG